MKKITVVYISMMFFCALNLYGAGSVNWYTGGADEAILYPSGGMPGEGTESVQGMTGVSDWYAMLYDASAFDASAFDFSSFSSVDEARDEVMSHELYGDTGFVIAGLDAGTFKSAIYDGNIDGTANNLSGETVGSIIFNTANPNAANLNGVMFAWSSVETTMPDMSSTPPPTENYDAGVMGFDGAEWKAVPEPVSAMIAFLGVPVLVLARRRFNKK